MKERKKLDAQQIAALVMAGAKRAWTEKEPVLLIGVLAGAIMVAAFWPAVRLNFAAMRLAGGTDPARAEAFLREALGLWPVYILMLLFNSAVTVVVARLATGGRGEVLAGGLRALAGRLAWLLWRSLGAIGWLLLGAAALWLAAIVIWAPLSLLAGAGGLMPLLEGVFAVVLVTYLLFLIAALGLSLISECADHHLSVRGAWGLLKGRRIKLAAAIFVIYLATALINSILLTLAPENTAMLEDMRLALSLLHVLLTIVGTFFTFVWLAMTTNVAAEIGWPAPEAGTD